MIADVEHQKSAATAGDIGDMSRSRYEKFTWLSEACSHAVNAAFSLMQFISAASEQNPTTRVC
jgi:hypothetical protein